MPADAIRDAKPPDAVDVPAKAMFASAVGEQLRRIAEARLPIPASAGFEPGRDLDRLHIGVYSLQGADVAAVATGTFNAEAIEVAADGVTITPLGTPLSKSQYAGRWLFTTQDIGFVILTEKTALFGNGTGMRRALDRVQRGINKRELDPWLEDAIADDNAAIVGGIDVSEHPELASAAKRFPFLTGLKSLRLLGNFKAPGMNFAGTLTYSDEPQAASGKQGLEALQASMASLGWATALMGFGRPLKHLQLESEGPDVKFVLGLEGTTLRKGIDYLARSVGVGTAPVRANATPGVGAGSPAPGPSAPVAPAPGSAPPRSAGSPTPAPAPR